MVDPRVARDSDGKPLASCEVVILANKPRRSDNQPANITFRGVTPMAFKVRNNVKIVEGRKLHARACTKSLSARKSPTA